MRFSSSAWPSLSSMPSAMFSSTVSASKSEKCWKTMPMPIARAAFGFGDVHRHAVEDDLAGVGVEHAVDHLDQRRLAGAVLAEQRVDLAGPHPEAHVVVRQHPGERLGDAAQLQAVGTAVGHSFSPCWAGTVAVPACTFLARAAAQPSAKKAKRIRNSAATSQVAACTSLARPVSALIGGVADEAEGEAVRDRVGEGHHHRRQRRGGRLGDVLPVDVDELAHHQRRDEEQRRGGGDRPGPSPPAAR